MDEETEAQGGKKVPLPKVSHWRCLDPCSGQFMHAASFEGECFRALNSDMLLAPGPFGRLTCEAGSLERTVESDRPEFEL